MRLQADTHLNDGRGAGCPRRGLPMGLVNQLTEPPPSPRMSAGRALPSGLVLMSGHVAENPGTVDLAKHLAPMGNG